MVPEVWELIGLDNLVTFGDWLIRLLLIEVGLRRSQGRQPSNLQCCKLNYLLLFLF